jgi:hypothetical protein
MACLKYSPKKIADAIIESDAPISADLYGYYSKTMRKAVETGYNGYNPLFSANVSRFSAAKAYLATQQARRMVVDKSTGEIIPQNKVATKVLSLHNSWLKTEANTAATRARMAKNFKHFMKTDEVRLFPNLKWLPSTSPETRAEHVPFYERVWAKDDVFWSRNMPGQLWNCKCGLVQTADPVTEGNDDLPEVKPPDSLSGNPFKTGEIFSRTSYDQAIKNKDIQIDGQTQTIFPNLQDLLSHKAHIWHAGYYADNGGWLFTNRERIKQAAKNKQETAKYDKEYGQCSTLAKNGYKVEYLKDVEKSFDIYLDGVPADLKKTSGHNNIVKSAKHATRNQGAKIVVFEFEKMNVNIREQLEKLKGRGIRVKYFIQGENKVIDL